MPRATPSSRRGASHGGSDWVCSSVVALVGLHSACVVGVLARLQAIDERVSERGRGLGGALCSRGRLVYEEQRARGAGMEAWRQWPVPESDVGFRAGRPTNLPCTSPNGATALVARLRLLERRPSRYALWKIIAPVSQYYYYYILGIRWWAFLKDQYYHHPPIFTILTIFWHCLSWTSRLHRIRAAYRCHPSSPIPLALFIARYLPLPDTRHSQLAAPPHPRIGARSFRVLLTLQIRM